MKRLLATLRRWLNQAVPRSRRIKSVHSGVLEVTWQEGRKVLNSAHANYSYGPLHKVMRYGLLFTEPTTAGAILVLGLGGGSVVHMLRHEYQAPGPITAVELDPVVIRVAAEEFNIQPDATLHIACADAFAWVATAPAAGFGLIVVDLFIDLDLPAGLYTADFWQQLWRLLRPGGFVVFNTLISTPVWVERLEIHEYLAEVGFLVKDVEVEEFNRLLILRKPD
ncbi:methyltransferase domain-containing protein [Hymenobacter sediminis]|uniref:spermidine synthase n=1 Tax=Hymenobacter sediminis TaxID=2218621 RepID=UPI000DA6D55C|nr:fused MFS/spermidine synthase [Hymenobacter sediminis]RPD49833.1 methyltransferase domain-containing protein [Hymenobacter sediminis]